MKLHILTIVLDGMPQITWHLPVFNQLVSDWHWHIVHGVADNVNDTRWCAKLPPRLSIDGTTEYLQSLEGHPRITIHEQPLWPGKTAMCNAALSEITEPGLLIQIDSDELWDFTQLERLQIIFDGAMHVNGRSNYVKAIVPMLYFVGQNIVTVGENCYGNNRGEWVRAWRFTPGMQFKSHEPPVLASEPHGQILTRSESRTVKIMPRHYAYVFEHQVAFKEQYYRYTGAVQHWKRLQAHQGPWPVRLHDFLPWVDRAAQAQPLYR
jgi:hypothetical protein